MPRKAKKITIQEVARLAGVSPSSVSKVFNDRPGVSKETIQRVRQTAEMLGFRPNVVARSLRVKRTLTLGLLTDDIEGVFTTSLVRGVEEAITPHGFNAFLCNSYGDPEKERAHIQALLDKQVDGLILLSGYRVRARPAPAAEVGHLPLVYLYQYTQDLPIHCVIPDDFGGGVMGTRHLVELGHRRIALINGPADYEAAQLRLEGYRQALQEAGLAFDPALVACGDWNQRVGYQLAHQVMKRRRPPTAIFSTSDILSIGVADALHELGLRIPEDVALVSFDNRFFAENQRPPLTDVALPLYEMGYKAGELLLESIREKKRKRGAIHKIPCYLVVRASCGARRESAPQGQPAAGSLEQP